MPHPSIFSGTSHHSRRKTNLFRSPIPIQIFHSSKNDVLQPNMVCRQRYFLHFLKIYKFPVLDLVADAGGIENKNNKTTNDSERLHLIHLATGVPLNNSDTIEKAIQPGESILLEYKDYST
jgi:hypothetical protein